MQKKVLFFFFNQLIQNLKLLREN